MQANGLTALGAYQMMLIGYALGGIMLLLLFLQLSEEIEAEGTPDTSTRRVLGLHASRKVVARLSALFALDAFAGGFIVQSMVAYWFHKNSGSTRLCWDRFYSAWAWPSTGPA